MPLPYELILALRYLRFHRGRTFLSIITLTSVAGVTVGTAALVIALSLMAGFVEDVRQRIHSGSAHLTVMSAEEMVFEEAEALVRRVEAVPGVQAASPVLHSPALLVVESLSTQGFTELHGIDPRGHAEVIAPDAEETSPFLRLGRHASGRAGIVLGAQLAASLHAAEGDLIRALVPEVTLTPWGAMPRSQVFEVVGTYRSEHFQEDAQRAYVELEAMRRLLRAKSGTKWIEIRLQDLRQLGPMKGELRRELSPAWIVVDLMEANQDILKALNTEKLILFLAIGLIVVVAALNIISTLVLMVNDKTKEIGTLVAMGARPGAIATVFMLQGLVIGLVGTGAGMALGAAACFWLDRYRVIHLNPEVYYLDHIPFTVQGSDLVAVAAAAVLISFAATLYPALKAARLDPVEAIRHE